MREGGGGAAGCIFCIQGKETGTSTCELTNDEGRHDIQTSHHKFVYVLLAVS